MTRGSDRATHGRPGGGRRGTNRRAGGRSDRGRAPLRRLPSAITIGIAVPADDVIAHVRDFRVLEIDAGAVLLVDRLVGPWVDRTPETTRLDVRVHRLLTQHPAPSESLPSDVRSALPADVRSRPLVYPVDLPGRALDALLDRFLAEIEPLREMGKLGALVCPFPSYFLPSARALDYLAWLRERTGELPIAVELRHKSWVDSEHRPETLRFLEEHHLSYVSVDTPPGLDSSLPPLTAATTDLAVVRFHGRDARSWERAVDSGDDRISVDYRRSDLEPWRNRLEKLAGTAKTVHVLFTTGTPSGAARDARLLLRVLTEPTDG
jgi:uncharacterized protein YecE (DUF72 family)